MPHPAPTPGLRRGRATLPIAAFGLMVLGVGIYLAGSGVERSRSPDSAIARLPVVGPLLEPVEHRVVGGNVPVNASAPDPLDLEANNSPTIVANPRDPTNLSVVNRVDTPRFACHLRYSTDGAASWSSTTIPIPAGEEPKCFAPDAAYDTAGTLYISYVTLAGSGNVPHALWVTSSHDEGRSLAPPVRVSGPLGFQVRIATDPVQPMGLYLTWLQADEVGTLSLPHPGNPIVMARSRDGGAHWDPPTRVTPPERQRAIAPAIATGPGGDLYVLYVDVKDDTLDYAGAHAGRGGEAYVGRWALVLARSRDGGTSWTEAVVDDSLVPIDRFIVFFPPSPSLAVDQRSGRVYAAFHDARGGSPDVYLWSSSDGGASFGGPLRVNDTAPDDRTSQYLPRVAIARDGRVDVVYYDRRADRDNIQTDLSLQSSQDEGRHFGISLRLTDHPFDSRVGLGSKRGLPDLGSRLGLVSTNDRTVALWADTRSGTEASGKQDIAEAVAAVVTSPRGDGWLHVIGATVVSMAALVAAWWLGQGWRFRRRGRRRTQPSS